MLSVLTNDHFLLGVGLATGPAIIVCILIYLFFKYVKDVGKTMNHPTDSLMSMEGGCCPYHSGLVKDTTFTIEECKAIWLEIKEINQRQMSLRERLPRDFVSKEDLKNIQIRLGNIDLKLDRYYELGVHNMREREREREKK